MRRTEAEGGRKRSGAWGTRAWPKDAHAIKAKEVRVARVAMMADFFFFHKD